MGNDMEKQLLILGAGGHGKVVCEVAAAMEYKGKSIYKKIDFLDDQSPLAIGKLEELEHIASSYDDIFCGIGNNEFRSKLLERMEKIGIRIPILIHPTAYISMSAVIERGTVVEPAAIINAAAVVQKGCIVSVGSIIDHDVVVESYCHINAGAICKAGSRIKEKRKTEAGEVILGY